MYSGKIAERFIMDDATAIKDFDIRMSNKNILHERIAGLDLYQQFTAASRRFMVVATRVDKDNVTYGYWIVEMTDHPTPPFFRYANEIESSIKQKKIRLV